MTQTAGQWALAQKYQEESTDELIKRLNAPGPSAAVSAGYNHVTYEDVLLAQKDVLLDVTPQKEVKPKPLKS
jgi:hypothetical protein